MIRSAVSEDYEQIKKLIVEAFTNSEYGYTGEAELVNKIRQEKNYIELVYLEGNKVVGRGLLSESYVENDSDEIVNRGLILAPLSVLADYQNRGKSRL